MRAEDMDMEDEAEYRVLSALGIGAACLLALILLAAVLW